MRNRIRELFYTQQEKHDLDLCFWLMCKDLVEVSIGETDKEGNNFQFKQTPEQREKTTKLLLEGE